MTSDSGARQWRVGFTNNKNGHPEVHPNLHKLAPESKEPIQCLHHAHVYDAPGCYLVIGIKRSILGTIKIAFPWRIWMAYDNIMKFIFQDTYSWAWQEGCNMPDIPDNIVKAFNRK